MLIYIYIYQEGRGDSFEHFAPRRRLLSLETLVAPQEAARYSVYLLYWYGTKVQILTSLLPHGSGSVVRDSTHNKAVRVKFHVNVPVGLRGQQLVLYLCTSVALVKPVNRVPGRILLHRGLVDVFSYCHISSSY